MGLYEQARSDWQDITTNTDDFGVEITVINADDSESCTVTGITTRHHLQVTREGVAYNGRKAHVSISETEFERVGFTIRDTNGEVNLKNFKVSVDGAIYIVNEWYPSDTYRLITIILGDFSE